MESFSLDNLPRWIGKTYECIWCDEPQRLYHVRQVKDCLQCWYICDHEDCLYMQRYSKSFLQGVSLGGKSLGVLLAFLEKAKEEEKKKPAESTEEMGV